MKKLWGTTIAAANQRGQDVHRMGEYCPRNAGAAIISFSIKFILMFWMFRILGAGNA